MHITISQWLRAKSFKFSRRQNHDKTSNTIANIQESQAALRQQKHCQMAQVLTLEAHEFFFFKNNSQKGEQKEHRTKYQGFKADHNWVLCHCPHLHGCITEQN